MASQDSHKFGKVLERLGATFMLSDLFFFTELKEAADDYDELVNGTIREVQSELYPDEDCTLPLDEVRKLITVYWHLNYLSTDLAGTDPDEARVWQQKQVKYLDRWKALLSSKHYPEGIIMTFEEYGCKLKLEDVQQSLEKAIKPPYSGTPFTVSWHLALLCNDLQDLDELEEKDLWKSEQSLYTPLGINEKRLYRRTARSYANYVGDTMRRFTLNECRCHSLREYYIKCFRERRKSERLKGKQRALKYVLTRASKQPQE
ncbi:hypothetical protein Q7P35_005571 [Cladosporium inversicolor]